MKKIIATTTINEPTEAIRKYDAMENWELLVVGDKKTPAYQLERGYFMGCDEQYDKYRDLCDLIGWNSVARGRMIAWIEAYKQGADILASIDDDCMPQNNWGEYVCVGAITKARYYEAELAFDPYRIHGKENFWHRGFPLECLNWEYDKQGRWKVIEPLVQEDLCGNQADYDATVRIAGSKPFECYPLAYYFSNAFSPINTQNIFLHRSVIKDFPANIPFIGRADDIWAGYIFQALHPQSTLYGMVTALHNQLRSFQSIVDDLENEIFMYRNTYKFLQAITVVGLHEAMKMYLPSKSLEAIDLYGSYFY